MIKFKNIIKDPPFQMFKEKYDQAIRAGQNSIEAVVISSYDKYKDLIDSRYVNLKLVEQDRFIFFTNYSSPKSLAFASHNEISALFFWSKINVQIRLKAKIKKTSRKFNQDYFKKRSPEKNALAISSSQSEPITSYKNVIKNYNETFKNDDLSVCPNYWGGYSFVPHYFEFWEGHKSRLNKRDVYEMTDDNWKHFFLQP